jgi:hypothetical protein
MAKKRVMVINVRKRMRGIFYEIEFVVKADEVFESRDLESKVSTHRRRCPSDFVLLRANEHATKRPCKR